MNSFVKRVSRNRRWNIYPWATFSKADSNPVFRDQVIRRKLRNFPSASSPNSSSAASFPPGRSVLYLSPCLFPLSPLHLSLPSSSGSQLGSVGLQSEPSSSEDLSDESDELSWFALFATTFATLNAFRAFLMFAASEAIPRAIEGSAAFRIPACPAWFAGVSAMAVNPLGSVQL